MSYFITNSKIGYNGRLGNQLFQFASLYGLARQTEKSIVLPKSNLTRRNEYYADGSIKKVGLDITILFPTLEKYLMPIELFDIDFKVVREERFGYDQQAVLLSSKRANIDLDGWFQSIDYFSSYENEIQELLLSGDKRTRIDKTIAVHVRRTDYLHLSKHHTNLGMDYYEEAMNLFPDYKFAVFSDDINWCKSKFNEFDCTFYSGGTEKDDLLAMSSCEGNIIANSTFSWWGAFLNDFKDKVIVAPKKWFGDINYNKNAAGLLSLANIVI